MRKIIAVQIGDIKIVFAYHREAWRKIWEACDNGEFYDVRSSETDPRVSRIHTLVPNCGDVILRHHSESGVKIYHCMNPQCRKLRLERDDFAQFAHYVDVNYDIKWPVRRLRKISANNREIYKLWIERIMADAESSSDDSGSVIIVDSSDKSEYADLSDNSAAAENSVSEDCDYTDNVIDDDSIEFDSSEDHSNSSCDQISIELF